jgi:hypothetical protein
MKKFKEIVWSLVVILIATTALILVVSAILTK